MPVYVMVFEKGDALTQDEIARLLAAVRECGVVVRDGPRDIAHELREVLLCLSEQTPPVTVGRFPPGRPGAPAESSAAVG